MFETSKSLENKGNMNTKDLQVQSMRIVRLNSDIEGLKERKASIEELQLLNTRIDKFTEIENIEYIITKLLPKMQKFTDNIDFLYADNKDVKNCVRQFDLSIGTKANKIELKIVKEEMHSKFILEERMKGVDLIFE